MNRGPYFLAATVVYMDFIHLQIIAVILSSFAYSPNVQLWRITTTDLKFENSDHQPVTAEFSVR